MCTLCPCEEAEWAIHTGMAANAHHPARVFVIKLPFIFYLGFEFPGHWESGLGYSIRRFGPCSQTPNWLQMLLFLSFLFQIPLQIRFSDGVSSGIEVD